MTYYAHAQIELRWAGTEDVIKETEKQVKKHLGNEPTRQEWLAIGPSSRVNGAKRHEVWEFGKTVPYWALWLEYWAYVE